MSPNEYKEGLKTSCKKKMKRLTFLLTFLLNCVVNASAGDIFVSTDGNDRSEGTKEAPVKTVHQALRMAREWRRLNDIRQANGINIILREGRYRMDEPLLVRPEDSGTEVSPTHIRSMEGERAVLCGDPMQQHEQLYPASGMERMLGFDQENHTITVPLSVTKHLKEFLHQTKGSKTFTPAIPLNMVVHQRWAIAILRIKDITVSKKQAVVSFLEPESKLEFEHPWPQPIINGEKGSSSFLIRKTEQRDGIERLVVIQGTDKQPIEHLHFEDLTFENTCWNRPLHKGHVTLQGGFPVIDAYKLAKEGLPWAETLENQAWIERPVAAVSVTNARHVDFSGCTFRNLGSTALDYMTGVSDCSIVYNRFENIGGNAILAGSFAESPREVHCPYTDLAPLCRRLLIHENTITNASCEDWGAVGIGCGYVSNTSITDNTVSHVNYSGICVGWGWTPKNTGMRENVIAGNKVTDFARQLYDAGGIYTLSNQPNSVIENNVIDSLGAAPYATNDRGFYIYLDAETDGYTIRNNWCPQQKFGDNHPGPAIVWGENGPEIEKKQ